MVFLGPSLPAVEARSLTSGLLLPPARQGDVWRALALRPRVLVLIDGVFELQPSVWHRELLSALDAGVAVFGASSMGALRAAELDARGMIGIGTIYRGYAERRWVDDADVALLHAGEDDGYRPLTVPLVSVRHVAELAHRHRILTGGEARRLVETAGAMFYQERRWPAVLREMQRVWGSGVEVRFRSWFEAGVEDVKAADARACLCAAEAFRQGAPSA
ncbi:MAG TPA: TfuA-like protein, partial [Myxococcaceae bacterium]|nr:TfuA-like protein [Myxococcaceae bacterium]